MVFYSVCFGILLVCAGVYFATHSKDTTVGTLPALIAITASVPIIALLVLHGTDQLLGLSYESGFPGGTILGRGITLGLGLIVGRLWTKHFG